MLCPGHWFFIYIGETQSFSHRPLSRDHPEWTNAESYGFNHICVFVNVNSRVAIQDEGEGSVRLYGNSFGGGMMSGHSNEGKGVFSLSAGRWIWVKDENREVTLETVGMGGRVKVRDSNGVVRQLATEK